MPLYCSPAIVHLFVAAPWDTLLLTPLCDIFSQVFLSLFPFVCVFHSMIQLLSQLSSCLPALHHVLCLLLC